LLSGLGKSSERQATCGKTATKDDRRDDMMKDQDADMQGETIRVGMLHSKSGMMAISEVSLLDAGMMAIAEINVCEHSSSDRPWSDSEVKLLGAVADQLAMAIDQAKLYEQQRIQAAIATAQATTPTIVTCPNIPSSNRSSSWWCFLPC